MRALDIGSYDRRLTWQKYAPTADVTYGQSKEAWTPNGNLWANVDEIGASKDTNFESLQARSTAVIRVRQLPAISALDRFVDQSYNEVWVVDGVRRGKSEMICDCHKWERQDGGL